MPIFETETEKFGGKIDHSENSNFPRKIWARRVFVGAQFFLGKFEFSECSIFPPTYIYCQIIIFLIYIDTDMRKCWNFFHSRAFAVHVGVGLVKGTVYKRRSRCSVKAITFLPIVFQNIFHFLLYISLGTFRLYHPPSVTKRDRCWFEFVIVNKKLKKYLHFVSFNQKYNNF